MNIVGRLKNSEEIKTLVDLGLDVFLLDLKGVTTKGIYSLNIDELKEVTDKIKIHQKKIYLLINKIIHEKDIELVETIFNDIENLKIDGIVINDLSVYVIAKKHQLENRIIYQPGTMNTNSYDAYFFKDKIKGITLSKELTLEEIKTILMKNYDIEYSFIGHGYLDMFYSKRKLLTNYFIHKNITKENIKNNHNFILEEKTRKETQYPIIEDDYGTHIFRSKKLESFNEIKNLKNQISDFFIERLLIDDDEYYDSIKLYKNILSYDEFLLKYGDEYNKGFYYLPTEKVKGDRNED
ncbi:MAG: U32 family peptidase [Candidatus Izimaplasma sp.]|nr:U32 family peptidase [Candidatus Izimaplasma bacterium]